MTKRDKTKENQTAPNTGETLLDHLCFNLQAHSPQKKTHPVNPSHVLNHKIKSAPYAQTKLADHEHSNLDFHSTVAGCPFFELAIGTSWHTFCFSTYAGLKDQPVATRESQFSELTMTHQTHSNSLLYAMHINAVHTSWYFQVCIYDYLSKQPMSTNGPVAMGQFQSPNGIAAVLTAASGTYFQSNIPRILCAHNLSLMLPGEQKTHISHPSSLLPPCGNSRASLGAGLP